MKKFLGFFALASLLSMNSFATRHTHYAGPLVEDAVTAAKEKITERKSEVQSKTSNTAHVNAGPYISLIDVDNAQEKKAEKTSNVDAKKATVQSKIDDRKADTVGSE